uniref:Rep protein n=1 Tax=Escherichia coli TaxID=562 RepID=A0A3G4RXB4_ECOLX|nr:hypothetical protein D0362_00156 [Escherichia coli]
MEGAKNAYRAFQEVRRADTPSQGLSGRQEPRQPPAKPICTVQAATRLVGGRRPSVLQRWGSGVLPRRFPVALKALPEPWRLDRSGDRGAKHARDFEAAKEQCRIDNPMSMLTFESDCPKRGFCLCLPLAQFENMAMIRR